MSQTFAAPQGATMADGRQLLYFSDRGVTAPAPSRDGRELPERPPSSELRFDPLLGEWIAFAAHRQTRTHLPPADQCPLCPTTESNPSEIPAKDYHVVVFENRFPSFGLDQQDSGWQEQTLGTTLGSVDPAHGRCEVVVFGSDHQNSLSGMSSERVRTVVEAWTHRTDALYALAGIQQVFPFENRGAEIGVTLHHPHGQIYAYPYVPARVQAQLRQVLRHREATGGNLFEDVLKFELESGERIVERGEHWTLYVPFAARMPIEVHLVPNRHVGDLTELTDAERDELAVIYHRLLRGVDALYSTPTPYISGWYQAPRRGEGAPADGREDYRLHLQLTSPRRAENKLKYLAGSEAVMGAFIGDVMPEAAAAALRGAIASLAD